MSQVETVPESAPGEAAKLISDYTRAIEADPSNSLAYRARGLQFGRAGEYDRAISDFDQAIRICSTDGRAFGLRGIAWQRKGFLERAIADFDRAIELDPANSEVYSKHRSDVLNREGGSNGGDGSFSLLLNPFILLRISPDANVQQVKQACDDAIEDEIAPADDLQRAQQVLLAPKLRLDAEVSGLLDVTSDIATQIIGALKKRTIYSEWRPLTEKLHSLPRSNLLAHIGAIAPLEADALLALLEAQSGTAAGAVCEAINEARESAGIAKADRGAVEDAINKLQDRQIKAVTELLSGIPSSRGAFLSFVTEVLKSSDVAKTDRLGGYVQAYGRAVSAELSRRREAVTAACEALRSDPRNAQAMQEISTALHHWEEVARPMQAFEAHMSREEPEARNLYMMVRDLCLWLANEKGEYEVARTITTACADVFSQLPRSIGQMREESEILERLQSEKIAIELLGPLNRLFDEAQQKHREIEKELLRAGFASQSAGLVGRLFDEFAAAVKATEGTPVSDLPWRIVRQLAISLNNDSHSPKAASALMTGLTAFFGVSRPSAEMAATLQADTTAARKNVIEAEIVAKIGRKRFAAAIEDVDRLLSFDLDQEERASIQNMRGMLKSKRRSQLLGRWTWGAIAAVVLIGFISSEGNNNSSTPRYYPPPSTQSGPPPVQPAPVPPRPPVAPAPGGTQASAARVERPPVGTNLVLSRENIRYCSYASVRMDAARKAISTQTAILAFNAIVDDWNSRCGSFRYRTADKQAVDDEIPAKRAELEAQGRAFAQNWSTPPNFKKSGLLIDTTSGRRTLTVELALNQHEWVWGTSFRTSMPADSGMLYLYPAAKTLNNTMTTAYFPLDVIFIDDQGIISEIYPNRPARTSEVVVSKSPGRAMLELNAGTVQRLGIRVGDRIHTFDLSNASAPSR